MRQDLTKYTKIVLQKRIRPTVGGWGWPNDYATSKVSSGQLWWLITRCMGGVEAGQNVDYVILEWSLIWTLQKVVLSTTQILAVQPRIQLEIFSIAYRDINAETFNVLVLSM